MKIFIKYFQNLENDGAGLIEKLSSIYCDDCV